MTEIETRFPQMYPDGVLNELNDKNIPEIDPPKESNATDVIPDEVPRRDGPGGE